MKKYYKNPKKRNTKLTKKGPTFNKEQLAFYEGFYKDVERLEREWNLCKDKYEEAIKFVKEKGIKFDTKMALQRIAKYWNSRKIALEKVLDKDDTVKKFRDKRNESKKNSKDGEVPSSDSSPQA